MVFKVVHLITGSLDHQGLKYGEMLIMHMLVLKLGFYIGFGFGIGLG